MRDPRYAELARVIVRYATELKEGERLLVEAIEVPEDIVCALVEEARAVGAHPIVNLKTQRIQRALLRDCTAASVQALAEGERFVMERVQAYVALRGARNATELADVPAAQMKHYQTHWWKPVHLEVRVPRTRWVVLRWPLPSMAQAAGMSTEAFEDYFFRVCTLDYRRLSAAMDPLVRRLEAADQVHIRGPDTDLGFSIRGIPVVKCDGKMNLPDGEVFTAPVRDSVEGHVHFNTETIYQGYPYRDVRLRFSRGRIVEATASDTERLNRLLDADEGARYVGEFALGLNPYIERPIQDTLFDEKICGSFHFTPGNAYGEADNGNRSEIHWDLVMIQTPAWGGGEIYLDGELIRRDGRFVPRDLQPLNPENLR